MQMKLDLLHIAHVQRLGIQTNLLVYVLSAMKFDLVMIISTVRVVLESVNLSQLRKSWNMQER